MKIKEKFIYVTAFVMFVISILYFAPKFVDVPKTLSIAVFDKNSSIDIDLPRGSNYLFYLESDKNITLNFNFEILHNNKTIYKVKLDGDKTLESTPMLESLKKSKNQKLYNIIPYSIALDIFKAKEKYKFIFNFNKKPQTKLKLKLFYLSHW